MIWALATITCRAINRIAARFDRANTPLAVIAPPIADWERELWGSDSPCHDCHGKPATHGGLLDRRVCEDCHSTT